MSENLMYSQQEGADVLGIGLNTLHKLIVRRENPLPHIRVGKRVLIPRDRLEAWIEAETDRQVNGWTEV